MSDNSSAYETTAILMVMMDPPDADEREFHDWYDLEHVPERDRIEGFRKVQRYVCLEGWPRYMALYDLDYLDVLKEPPYAAISGENFSPWSKRVISGVRGWTRTEAEQVYPGKAATGAKGPPLRIAVLRFRGVPAGQESETANALEAFLAEAAGLLQIRLFRSTPETGGQLYAFVEFAVPQSFSTLDWSKLALPSGYVDVSNMYSRYWRRE